MKCPICGAEIESDSKFCTSCGKQLDNNTVQTPSQAAIKTTTVQTNTKSNNHTVLIIIAILGGLFVFGTIVTTVLGFILYKVGNDTYPYEDIIDDRDGEIIKTIVDPTGHEIILEYDNIYLVKTETDYLYDKSDELVEKAKIATKEEIDNLSATKEQKMATIKTIEYLNNNYYSKQDIIDKLKEAGYDKETIKYAIENSGADWNERALIEAMNFLASGGFSKTELISILQYTGYSEEEATMAANSSEIDYYEQAVYDACFYKYTEKSYGGSYSREKAKKSLEYAKYTDEEIEFALKTVYDELEY